MARMDGICERLVGTLRPGTPDRVLITGDAHLRAYLAEAKLLEAVFLICRLPAWGTTLGSRVAKHPKLHLVDSGVMAWLLSLTPEKIAQAMPAALTDYGHLLETFAVGEILKQASWSDAPVTTRHFRTQADLKENPATT
jgi:predicted AAA+ superfamily ATPase